jgi:hypothetical protein
VEEIFGPSGKTKKFEITTVVTTTEKPFGKIEITTMEEVFQLFGPLGKTEKFEITITTVVTTTATTEKPFGKIEITTMEELFGLAAWPAPSARPKRSGSQTVAATATGELFGGGTAGPERSGSQ